MILADVMAEVGSVVDTITGLRVFPHPVKKATSETAVVGYPESFDFDLETGRGADKYTRLPVLLVLGDVVDRATVGKASEYVAGGGARSLKAALEAHAWTSCDDVWCSGGEFDTVTFAGNDYLGIYFYLDVVGDGGEG